MKEQQYPSIITKYSILTIPLYYYYYYYCCCCCCCCCYCRSYLFPAIICLCIVSNKVMYIFKKGNRIAEWSECLTAVRQVAGSRPARTIDRKVHPAVNGYPSGEGWGQRKERIWPHLTYAVSQDTMGSNSQRPYGIKGTDIFTFTLDWLQSPVTK